MAISGLDTRAQDEPGEGGEGLGQTWRGACGTEGRSPPDRRMGREQTELIPP